MKFWSLTGSSVTSLRIALTVGIFAVCTINTPVFAQNSQGGSIDLERLIKLYMIPKSGHYNILEWDTGSAPGTPITWQHSGIKECDASVLDKDLAQPNCRYGKVIVTIGGRPTHKILGRIVEPGQWKIVLAGPRAGVNYAILDSDVLSQELSPGLLKTAASKAGSTMQLSSISKCGGLGDGSEQLSVNAPGKETAFVREWWSCGSGGCNIQIIIAPTKDNAGSLLRCAF